MRRPNGAAPGSGFQGDTAAAKLTGGLGGVAEERRQSSSQAFRGQTQLCQGSPPVSAQVELLQARPLIILVILLPVKITSFSTSF